MFSLCFDIKILFMTVKVVFKSAGIEEGVIVAEEDSSAEKETSEEA